MALQKRVKYSPDPEHRVKNKDGTVKRFPNERFVGDVVIPVHNNYGNGTYVKGPDGLARYVVLDGERVVEALVGPNRVKLEGSERIVYIENTSVIRKIY